jgi:hypothetical protein
MANRINLSKEEIKKIKEIEKSIEANATKMLKNRRVIKYEEPEITSSMLEDIIDDFESENDDELYTANAETFDMTFIEFAMFNKYFYSCYRKPTAAFNVSNYGYTDSMGRVNFGGSFEPTEGWWFQAKLEGDDNEYILHTKIFQDNRQDIITQLHVTLKKGMQLSFIHDFFKKVKALAFNNSEYVGKCIKVKLRDNRFRGIEIIEFEKNNFELILNDVQKKYIEHFISRVKRGSSARYLLNGEPGTGKTESIRDIIRNLIPDVTFVIPDFSTCEDLTVILEACEIFDRGVIIMDDIDLYLGSRDNGSYTRLLGEFLSFFDGVKKRKISLLASTNDKGLVDKAAERPGRFNMTLDYTFLTEEQVIKVCKIHLPEKYHVEAVYNALNGHVNGKKANITGAFIANLADNVKEMSEDDENWSIEDTVSLITESYKGFYMSQVDKNKNNIGFKIN